MLAEMTAVVTVVTQIFVATVVVFLSLNQIISRILAQ
jgi:hypothetical protein